MNLTVNSNSGMYDISGNVGGSGAVNRVVISDESQLVNAKNIISVKTGDVFSGQIVDFDDEGMVKIMLGEGSTVDARLSSGIPLNIGQMLSFQVKSSGSGEIKLMPLYANLDGNSAVGKALHEAGLPVTKESADMVSSMMEHGMSVDAKSLNDMDRLVAEYPLASPKSIVQMVKLGIPINETSVTQFEVYKAEQHKIADGMQSLAGEFAELSGESESLNKSVLNLFSRNLPSEFTDALKSAIGGDDAALMRLMDRAEAAALSGTEGRAVQTDSDINNPLKGTALPGSEESNMAGPKGGTDAINAGQKENVQIGPDGKVQQESIPANEIDIKGGKASVVIGEDGSVEIRMKGQGENPQKTENFILDENRSNPAGMKEGFLSKIGLGGRDEKSADTAAINLSEHTENRVTDDLTKLLSDKGRSVLSDLMEKAGVPDRLTGLVREGRLSTGDTLSLIKETLEIVSADPELEEALSEDIKRLITSKPYQALLKNGIMNEFLLKPEDVSDKEKVREYYQKIAETAQKSIELLNSAGKEASPLKSGMQDLKQNLDFMNQMNQAFAYIQLPLKMNDLAKHGDLYVYTNKKNLAKRDGNISALLHLDMAKLGTMDIHVTMTDVSKVTTHFILQDEEMLDFLAGHLPELDEALSKRGYTMTSDVALNREEKSVPEIMFNRGANVKLIQQTSFDVRA